MSLETVTDDTFEEKVVKSSIPVIVDFYGTWCGPCKALAPKYEEVSKQYTDKVKFLKCECDTDGSKTSVKYKIKCVPTLIVFDKGEEVGRKTGNMDKDTLIKFIDESTKVKK